MRQNRKLDVQTSFGGVAADDAFNGDKLRLAREARGMSQAELSERSEVPQSILSKLESDIRTPSAGQAAVLADALDVKMKFFSRNDPVLGAGVGELFHRRRTIGQKAMARVHAKVNIHTFVLRDLLSAVNFPVAEMPTYDLDEDPDIEGLAATLRARWFVPPGPVRNVCDLLHRVGVLIVPFDFEGEKIDAIGQWTIDLPPIVFINEAIPPDRMRLTLMHEVAHFCLHQRASLSVINEDIEREANLFAAAFLMPAHEIGPMLRGLGIAKLGALKLQWRVSMGVLAQRAKQLGTISPRAHEEIWRSMSKHGYRLSEPSIYDIPAEDCGRRVRELFDLHRQDLDYTLDELGEMFGLNTNDVRMLVHDKPVGPGLRLISP